jgi:hypothetical protein
MRQSTSPDHTPLDLITASARTRPDNHRGKAGQTGGLRAPKMRAPTKEDPRSQQNDHRIPFGGSGLSCSLVKEMLAGFVFRKAGGVKRWLIYGAYAGVSG